MSPKMLQRFRSQSSQAPTQHPARLDPSLPFISTGPICSHPTVVRATTTNITPSLSRHRHDSTTTLTGVPAPTTAYSRVWTHAMVPNSTIAFRLRRADTFSRDGTTYGSLNVFIYEAQDEPSKSSAVDLYQSRPSSALQLLVPLTDGIATVSISTCALEEERLMRQDFTLRIDRDHTEDRDNMSIPVKRYQEVAIGGKWWSIGIVMSAIIPVEASPHDSSAERG